MKPGLCAFCGVNSSKLEPDHVPPKSLFASPRPNNLITVPTCRKCHRKTTKDDEYLKLVLSLRHDVAHHPDVDGGVLASALRSLTRPQAAGHARAFARTLHQVTPRTPAGLILPKRGAYVADGQRVLSEIERITRGLYFHERREPLGAASEVRAFNDDFVDWKKIDKDGIETIRRIAGQISREPRVSIGRAFEYARNFEPRDPRISAWWLTFYDRISFLAVTVPEQNV